VWRVGGFSISIQDPLMFNAWCCRDDVPGLPQFLPPSLQLVQVLLVLNDEAVVLAKFLCELLCHTTARLPCLRGKIRAKGQAALDVEERCNDVAECTYYIWVMLDLAKAGLDIICMNDDVMVWVRQAKVPNSGENFLKGVTKDTVKFYALVS